jgi:hypothetical protein
MAKVFDEALRGTEEHPRGDFGIFFPPFIEQEVQDEIEKEVKKEDETGLGVG